MPEKAWNVGGFSAPAPRRCGASQTVSSVVTPMHVISVTIGYKLGMRTRRPNKFVAESVPGYLTILEQYLGSHTYAHGPSIPWRTRDGASYLSEIGEKAWPSR